MELKERLSDILAYYNVNAVKFALKINTKTPQAIRDILSGKTKSLSANITEKIKSTCPEISMSWLMTGEGTMLNSCNNNVTDKTKEKEEVSDNAADPLLTALHEITEMRKLFQEQVQNNQTQFNKFIEIIEKLTKN